MWAKKVLVAGALFTVSAGGLWTSTASAGEVKGAKPGESLEYIFGSADAELPAPSACAYSGLEDHQEYTTYEGNTKPGRLTQTPHYVYDDETANAFVNPPPGTPGFACRGNAEFSD